MSAKRAKFLIAGFVIIGAFVYLGVSGFKSDNLVYFYTVDEVAAKAVKNELRGLGVRVQGKIVPRSIQRNPAAMELAFRLQGEKSFLPVRYRGVPPDLLENGFPVIAEGKVNDKGVLVAKNLMVACPSKFEEMKEAGEEIPADHNTLVKKATEKKKLANN